MRVTDIEDALKLHLRRPLRPKEQSAVKKMLEVQGGKITESLFDAVLLAIPRRGHGRQRSSAQMFHLARRMSHFRDLTARATPVKQRHGQQLSASAPMIPRRLSTEYHLKDQRVWDVDTEMVLRGDSSMYAPRSPDRRKDRQAARPSAVSLAKRTRDGAQSTEGTRAGVVQSDLKRRDEKYQEKASKVEAEPQAQVIEKIKTGEHLPPDKQPPEQAAESGHESGKTRQTRSAQAVRTTEAGDEEGVDAQAADSPPSTARGKHSGARRSNRRAGFGCCSCGAAGEGEAKIAEGKKPEPAPAAL